MIHQATLVVGVGGEEDRLPWQPPAPDLPRPAGTGTEGEEGNEGRTDGQEERRRGQMSAKSSDARMVVNTRDVNAHVLTHPSRRRSAFQR